MIYSSFKTILNQKTEIPTETELKVLDTYWSDHCRHTTFETELTDIQFEGKFKETLEKIFNDYLEKENSWAEKQNLFL